MLSTVTWVGPDGGDWGTAANWSPVKVPTAGDDVVIEPSSAETIVHGMNQTDSLLSLTTNANATLNLNAGTLQIGAGSSTFGGAVTVAASASLEFASNATVQIAAGQTLAADGTLTFVSGDTVSLSSDSPATQIVVGGTLNATSTTFAVTGGNAYTPAVTINSGGVINPTGCTFGLPLFVPYTNVPALANNNVSFNQIEIEAGTLSSGELDLNAIGTDTTNLSYVFPGGFTIDPQGTLVVGANVAIQIAQFQTLAVNGTLTFSSGDAVTFANGGATPSQITVDGVLNATDTFFTGAGSSRITVNQGGAINATGCTFNLTLDVPYGSVPALANNVRFGPIEIESGTLSSGELDLNLIGTDTSNLSYVFPGGFTIGANGTLAVGAGVPVRIPAGQTLVDNGTLTFAAGDTVSLSSDSPAARITVGGTLIAVGTTFAVTGGKTDNPTITVNSGGVLDLGASTYGSSQLVLESGSNDTLHFNTFTGQLAIDSGAAVDIVGNDLSGVGSDGVIATGSPTAVIPLVENYWGTTDSTAIGALILDHNDDAARPTVNFQPAWPDASGVIAAPATALYSPSDQDIPLSATVATTAGVAISGGTVTFTVLDGNNQPVGQPTAPQPVNNGTVSATYTLPGGTAVGPYTIEAQFSGGGGFPAATDTSRLLTIVPGASQAAITSTPLNLVAGTNGPVTIQLEDSNGNPGVTSPTDQTIDLSTTSAAGAFYADQSGGTPITSVVIPAGQGAVTVYYMDTLAGTPTVTADDSALSSSSSQQETVTPAAASQLVIHTQPSPTATAGLAFDTPPVVYEVDPYGNLETGDNSTVITAMLQSGAGPLQGTTVTVSGGVATFTALADQKAETITLAFSGGGFTSATSDAVIVDPGEPTHLVITTQPYASVTAGNPLTDPIVVEERDQYENVVTTDNSTVVTASLASGVGTLIGATQATVQAGVASFDDLENDTAGTLTLQFATPKVPPVISDPSTVSPGPATVLGVVVSRPPGGIPVGTKFVASATAYDAYSNVATSFNSPVTLSLASGSVGTLTGTLTQTAVAGVAQFDDLSNTTSGSISIDAAGGSLTSTPSDDSTATLIPGTPTALIVQTQPQPNATAGQPLATTALPVVIHEVDQYGNLETGDSSTVVIASLSDAAAALLGTTAVTVSGGVATFTDLSTQKAGTMTLEFSSTSLAGAASDPIVISPAAASQLAIQTQPSATATAGVPFATQPVIAEEDQYGNLETGDSGTQVTVSLASGIGPLQGATSATLVHGVATFSNLEEDTAGTISLEFASGRLTPATSNAIKVAAAPATQLVVTTPPPGTLVAGQPFTIAVSAEDPFGNVDSVYHGEVTISLPGVGHPITVQASDGVATFPGLTVSTTAQGGSIQAIAGRLASVSTPPIMVHAPEPPTISGAHVVFYQKKHKKGKPVRKRVVQGFVLDFSRAMDPTTAGLSANYVVTAASARRGKKKASARSIRVAVSAHYDGTSHAVTLDLLGKQAFARGGEITVIYAPPDGVASADGVALSPGSAAFDIARKGAVIAPA